MSFETSAETDKLDAALAKAQGEIRAAKKTKKNPHFGSMYADLDDVVEAIREALAKYEISFTQWPLPSEPNRLTLMTRLACAGQWMRATFSLPLSKQDAQGYGSALTYAKRYGLSAAVGVSSDECDDGNAASGKGAAPGDGGKQQNQQRREPAAKPPAGAKPPQGKPSPGPTTKPGAKPSGPVDPSQPPPGVIEFISADQSKRLFAIAGEKGVPDPDLKKIATDLGIASRSKIPVSKYNEFVRRIETWKAAT